MADKHLAADEAIAVAVISFNWPAISHCIRRKEKTSERRWWYETLKKKHLKRRDAGMIQPSKHSLSDSCLCSAIGTETKEERETRRQHVCYSFEPCCDVDRASCNRFLTVDKRCLLVGQEYPPLKKRITDVPLFFARSLFAQSSIGENAIKHFGSNGLC